MSVPLSVRTNIAALNSANNLKRTAVLINKSYQKLSSGYRINTSGDDAAGSGISDLLEGQIQSYNQAVRNAGDGISFATIADGATSEISNMVKRLRQLAIQSANGIYSDNPDRAIMNSEYIALLSEIDRTVSVAKFLGTNVLLTSIGIQVGIFADSANQITIDIGKGFTTTSLTIATTSIAYAPGALSAIASLDVATQNIALGRAGYGVAMNRLEYVINNLNTTIENFTIANSRIKDIDVAKETAELSRNQALYQFGTDVLANANKIPLTYIKLAESVAI
jgi:flagellin